MTQMTELSAKDIKATTVKNYLNKQLQTCLQQKIESLRKKYETFRTQWNFITEKYSNQNNIQWWSQQQIGGGRGQNLWQKDRTIGITQSEQDRK